MTCLMRQELVGRKPRLLNLKAKFTTTTTIFYNFGKAAFWTFYSFIVQHLPLHFSNAIVLY